MSNNKPWDLISKESKRPQGVLSDDFILRFDKYLNFDLLSENYLFTLDMLRTYAHRVTWGKILKRQQFPESFLREMALNFDYDTWLIISRYQVLSERFIRDFSESLDWTNILQYQNISSNFIKENSQIINQQQEGLIIDT